MGGWGGQTQFAEARPNRTHRAGTGAGAQLREAEGGRGESPASLEGETLPGGRKAPLPRGALPLGILRQWHRGVSGVPPSLLFTLEHKQRSGFPAPLLPQGQALSCHRACPQSLRGDADKAGAGAQQKRKLCIGNYTQECQKNSAPTCHRGKAPLRFQVRIRTRGGPSALSPPAGRGPGARNLLEPQNFFPECAKPPASRTCLLSQSPQCPGAPQLRMLLQTVAQTENPHLLPSLHSSPMQTSAERVLLAPADEI